MTLERRLAKMEAARGERPDPDADATFAALAEALDWLADLKAAGDAGAAAELNALAAVQHGRASGKADTARNQAQRRWAKRRRKATTKPYKGDI